MNTILLPDLAPFIQELKALKVDEHDEAYNRQSVSLLVKTWVKEPTWLSEQFKQVNNLSGFSSWLIHEEPNHSLAVNLVAWEPGREITPHDHNTWAVVGCVCGIEENYFWTRLDDGLIPDYAELKREEPAIVCHPGEVISIAANQIHSVINKTNDIAVSLHVYGMNLNFTNRLQYDPLNKRAKPFFISYS
ncbi:cupin [Legionella sp. D16C41]|uniref:cysteine dioxygenase family protein n=1 Tax=Legionella sp. D16C41 TaxID=3402688 RepID=UPI003AF8EACB